MTIFHLVRHHLPDGTETQLVAIVHSSQSMTFVAEDNPEYLAWLAEGNEPQEWHYEEIE